ncbi:hypothetical protein [uncultured Sulfitobacter sp.]|uniref:hypothetical protein n=1 Tax=uncultured Sulfitobacter sp. TaxID=191468 RepID=UPI0025999A74|nr:hypothetical protein [uncultured Sulfitobacter sp.]
MSKFNSLYDLQSGGYPMEQVLIIQAEDNDQIVPKVVAFFADAEMDVFMVEYGYDGEITLHAEDVTHISTFTAQLEKIISLTAQGETLRKEVDGFMNDDDGCVSGAKECTKFKT